MRLKKFMEMRGADGGPWRRICALPAFWVGLLYDAASLDAAWEVCSGWTAEERELLRHDAGKYGLRARGRAAGRSARSPARCWRSPRPGSRRAPAPAPAA